MKHLLITIFYFLMSYLGVMGQCNIPFPPGLSIAEAPLLCPDEFDGYCSTTPLFPNTQDVPPGFCGSVENNQWIAFVADSPTLELLISTSNCQVGDGVQCQIYSDCDFFLPASNCLNLGVPVPALLNATNLTAGQIYYLMMDGWAGDICDWSVEVVDGTLGDPCSIAFDEYFLAGPTLVSEGGTYTYSLEVDEAEDLSCVGPISDSCCTFGPPCLGTVIDVLWSAPPGSVISEGPGQYEASVTIGSQGGEICMTIVYDTCGNQQYCTTVEVLPPSNVCNCLNCPGVIEDQATSEFFLEINDVGNNDLNNPQQGVCAVLLDFEHEDIGDLSMTLTSPSGQSVQLAGPITTFNITAFTTWNIGFVPCDEMANPDFGIDATWNNNEPWANFQTYNGSYYPYNGCLEDFNNGPVNGTWTLSVDDGISSDEGELINFEIIFCDPAGLDCVCTTPVDNCQDIANQNIPLADCACLNGYSNMTDTFPAQDTLPGFCGTLDNPDWIPFYSCGCQTDISIIVDSCSAGSGLEAQIFTDCNNDPITPCVTILPGDTATLSIANVDPQAFDSYYLLVDGINGSTCGYAIQVEESDTLEVLQDTIFGNLQPCQGQLFTYTAPPVSGPAHYEWSYFSYDTLITSGDNTFTFDPIISGQICVTVIGGCEPGYTVCEFLSVANPPTIFEDTTICEEDLPLLYNGDTLWNPGTYPYTLSSLLEECDTSLFLSLQIEPANEAIISFSGPDTAITDIGLPVFLDGSVSVINGNSIGLEWTDLDGNLIATGMQIEATTPGWYVFSIIAQPTECTVSDSIFVPYIPTDCGYNTPAPPGDNCEETPILCSEYYASYCSDNQGFNPDTINLVNNSSCSNLTENGSWLGFSPCDSTISFEVEIPLCYTGNGLEFAVVLTDSCENFEVIGECQTANEGILDTITFTGLDTDETYYLLIDGIDAAECHYTIRGINGIGGSIPGGTIVQNSPAQIIGPTELCLGDTGFFTYIPPDCEFILDPVDPNGPGYGCQLPGCLSSGGTDTVNLVWQTSTPGAEFITDSVNVFVVAVVATDTNDFNIFVDLFSSGSGIPIDTSGNPIDTSSTQPDTTDNIYCCISGGIDGFCDWNADLDVDVIFDIQYEHYTICEGESIDVCGETYDYSTSFNCIDSCLLRNITIEVIPFLEINLGPIFLCAGECFFYMGNVYCAPGFYQEIFFGPEGCEELHTFEIIWEPYDQINVGPVTETCDPTSQFYTVSFDISGDGPFFASSGSIIGNTFVSDPIPTGTPYVFDITTSGFCPGNYTVSGNYVCPLICLIDAGSLSTTPINTCESETANVSHNGDEQIENDDILEFILHTGSDPLNGTIIARNTSGGFSYNNSMTFGTPYQVTCVAGNNNGGQVDLNDACLSMTSGPTITFYSDPEITVSGSGSITCTEPTATLDALASGGSGDFLFDWNAGGTGTSLTVNSGGLYSVTVTDAVTGCSAENSFNISEDIIPPEVDPIGGTINCSNPSLTLSIGNSSSGPEYSYSWETPDSQIINSPNPTISEPGNYILTITNNNNGCSSSSQTTVLEDTQTPDISFSQGGIIDCNNSAASIEVQTSAQNALIEWTTPTGQSLQGSIQTVNIPGDYQFTLTGQNGCSTFGEVEVVEDTSPPVLEFIQGGIIDCENTSIALQAESSTPNVQFEWTSPTGTTYTSPNPVIDEPGLYALIVTGSNGCTTQSTTMVESDLDLPGLTVEGETISCNEPVISLSASSNTPGVVFQWSGPIGFSSSSANPQINIPGDYSITITAPNNCEQSSTITVLADVLPPTVNLAGETITCSNPEATLQAVSFQPIVSYQWTGPNGFSDNGPSPQVTTVGNYILEAESPNGCTSTDTIFINKAPELERIDLASASPTCFDKNDGFIEIANIEGGVPPFDVSINETSTNNQLSFPFLEGGFYELVITDANDCRIDTQVNLIPPKEILVEIGENDRIILGDKKEIELQTNIIPEVIEWYIDGELFELMKDEISIKPLDNTVIEVVVKDNQGCEVREGITISVDKTPPFFIPNAFSPNGDGQNDVFTIFARDESVKQIKRLSIFNRWGDNVFTRTNFQPNDPSLGWDGTKNGQLLDNAVFVYMIEVELINGEVTQLVGDITLAR